MSKKGKIQANSLKIPKPIIYTATFLQSFSPKLTTLFAAKLFTTPVKYNIPKREYEMEQNSQQEMILIPAINKKVNVFHYGKGEKKIVLVHGWSGRGTQMVKIADALVKKGYEIISFDAPAHGKSEGKTSIMTEFIATLLELEKRKGPFEFAIGHSLGGMTILNSIEKGLNVKKSVTIGSGDIIQDILDDFVCKLHLQPKYSILLKNHFEKKYGEAMENYSGHRAASLITTPVLIIHDNDDVDVPIKAAHNIAEHLKDKEVLITNGLGHRKILGNETVINKIISFLHQ